LTTSPDPSRLDIVALPATGDPLSAALKPGTSLGLLGIELPTRRRNRMNGCVIAVNDGVFSLAVDQSFGNCPQYIHRRAYAALAPVGAPRIEAFTTLDPAARALIQQADTFFVASLASGDRTTPNHGVDVSHRGGPAGFLKFAAD
jgi:predicted pyridoxine 5'-phosphate oxidase superfamily flavin-nucleotide-binding protein